MLANQHQINNLIGERNEKGQIASSQGTDTEPEAELEKDNIQGQSQAEETIKSEEKKTIQGKKSKNGFVRFIEKLPNYQYDIPKKGRKAVSKSIDRDNDNIIPFDIRDSDNNRFASYSDAFFYIAEHCRKYHNRFTRDKCRQYLGYCYIIDFSHDEFIPICSKITKKEFNKYFVKTQREMKYI